MHTHACSNLHLQHAFGRLIRNVQLSKKIKRMAKKVPVSFLERKQVFEVPNIIEDDLSYLTSEVLKGFTFNTNVNLEVTFQKYDKDWDEYLDVSKDYRVEDKDRLKAVVTSSITDTTLGSQSFSTTEVQFHYQTT